MASKCVLKSSPGRSCCFLKPKCWDFERKMQLWCIFAGLVWWSRINLLFHDVWWCCYNSKHQETNPLGSVKSLIDKGRVFSISRLNHQKSSFWLSQKPAGCNCGGTNATCLWDGGLVELRRQPMGILLSWKNTIKMVVRLIAEMAMNTVAIIFEVFYAHYVM